MDTPAVALGDVVGVLREVGVGVEVCDEFLVLAKGHVTLQHGELAELLKVAGVFAHQRRLVKERLNMLPPTPAHAHTAEELPAAPSGRVDTVCVPPPTLFP